MYIVQLNFDKKNNNLEASFQENLDTLSTELAFIKAIDFPIYKAFMLNLLCYTNSA